MNNIIEIDHLSKTFGEVKAVQDLSFRVKEGELFAFLGVNGAGKSTTVNFPLSTQGQASAVGAIVSAGYGFVCGAYMPISQFSDGLQKVVSFLPWTYGTSLLRNHALRGVFEEMSNQGFPDEVVEAIRDSVDCNLYFFGEKVALSNMYMILIIAILIAVAIYVAMNIMIDKRRK